MRNRTFLPACVAVVALLLVPAFGAAPEPDNKRLYAQMERIAENLKAMAVVITNPETPLEDALRPMARAQAAVIEAKSITPARISRMDKEAQPDELKAYRAEHARLLIEFANMELALLEGDRQAAFGFVTGPLLELRKRAHERFQEPEQEG